MTLKVDAVFENGMLRPLQPLSGIDEHSRVHLTIEGVTAPQGDPFDCIGILPDEDAEDMRRALAEATPPNVVLLELAKKHPPPDSWWDETDDPFAPEETRAD